MKMFSDADGYRSEISTKEELELKKKVAFYERHGRLSDVHRITELENRLRDKDEQIKKILALKQEEFESGWYFTMDVVHMEDIKDILGIDY